ncbi:TPA: hypothetical protein ACN382_003884 [Vibrio parahaemolyticus]
MTDFHCGTRFVKGLAFTFDSANQRVCLGQSFYYDHFRGVREAVRTTLSEKLKDRGSEILSGFERILDLVLSDVRLLTFSNECSKALWKSCESREEAHNRMMYIVSTLATLANKKLAKVLKEESAIIRANHPEVGDTPSPMEMIAIILDSMSSQARKADEPIVSPIH